MIDILRCQRIVKLESFREAIKASFWGAFYVVIADIFVSGPSLFGWLVIPLMMIPIFTLVIFFAHYFASDVQ